MIGFRFLSKMTRRTPATIKRQRREKNIKTDILGKMMHSPDFRRCF